MEVLCPFCETVNDVPDAAPSGRTFECDLCKRPLALPQPGERRADGTGVTPVPRADRVAEDDATDDTMLGDAAAGVAADRVTSPGPLGAFPSRKRRQVALFRALLGEVPSRSNQDSTDAPRVPADRDDAAPAPPPSDADRAPTTTSKATDEEPLIGPPIDAKDASEPTSSAPEPPEPSADADGDLALASLPPSVRARDIPAHTAPDGTWFQQTAAVRDQFGIERRVIVNSFRPLSAEHALLRRLFFEDLRMAARLRHPYAAEILDFGERDRLLYVITDWIEGRSLASLCNASGSFHPIPLQIALRIASQACAVLHAAHTLVGDAEQRLELVHGDLRPDNVFISAPGVARVINFGLGRVKAQIAACSGRAAVDGPAPYRSPEQLCGGEIDPRSDVFSLGILLYATVTGRHPFADDDPSKAAENVLFTTPPRPRDLVPTLSPTLDRLICRALKKDRRERFESAAEMQRMIDAVTIAFRLTATDEELAAFAQTGCPRWEEPGTAADVEDDKFGALPRVLDLRQSSEEPRAPTGSGAAPSPQNVDAVDATTEAVVEPPVIAGAAPTRRVARAIVALVLAAAIAFVVIAVALPRARSPSPQPQQSIATEDQPITPVETTLPSPPSEVSSAPIPTSAPTAPAPQPHATGAAKARPPGPSAPAVAPNPERARPIRKPAAAPPPAPNEQPFRPSSI